MNEKLIKYAEREGFCCLWAFLEANRETHTSKLVELAKEAGFTMTARGIRHARRKYRRGITHCIGAKTCLTARIRAARSSP